MKVIIWLLIFSTTFSFQISQIDFSKYARAQTPSIKSSATEAEYTIPQTGKTEIASKRTRYSKTYIKSNSSKETVYSQSPLHFQDETDGMKWKDIEINLKANASTFGVGSGPEYTNGNNDFKANFSTNINQKLFSLNKGGAIVSLKPQNVKSGTNLNIINPLMGILSAPTHQIKDNKITYNNVYPNTDIISYSVGNGVKEDIVIKSKSGKNEFRFDLNIENATYQKTLDGSYKFFRKDNGQYVFTMPRFYMWDNKGGKDSEQNTYSYDVKSEIIDRGGKYEVVITADNKWLSSADRVYPVTIDPSFVTEDIEDTYIQTGYPNVLAWDQRALWVGHGDTKGIMRALVLFNVPVPDFVNRRIIRSGFEVLQYGNCSGICQSNGVYGYSTSNFNPWDATWNNRPTEKARVGSGQTSSTWDWFRMDVTDAAKHWVYDNYDGSVPGGLEFVQDGEANWGFRTWAARNHPDYEWGAPKLTIEYNDYNAQYYCDDGVNAVAGTTVDIPVIVRNTGNNIWYKSGYKLGYHLLSNSGRIIVQDGVFSDLPRDINPGGDQATVIAKIKAPPMSGNYTVQWDMVQPGVTWFSAQGVPVYSRSISVSLPSFSSLTHLGTESYYAKAGPVDLATGNLAFTSSDMSMPSSSGGISITRSYNSTNYAKTYTHDAQGFIHKWILNGSFYEENPDTRHNQNYLGADGLARPNNGSVSGGNLWFSHEDPSPIVDLNNALSQKIAPQYQEFQNRAIYAHTYVYSPADRNVLFKLGSDDGIRVWLNSQLVVDHNISRGAAYDQEVVSTSLKKGWNSLMLKITQGTGGWGLCARFTNTAGTPLPDLKYSVNNPDIFNLKGSLGEGWTLNIEESIFPTDPYNIYYKDGTGTVNIFRRNPDGSYARPAGASYDLVANGASGYTITYKDGLRKLFDTNGKLLNIIDLNNNQIKFLYNLAGRCYRIIDGPRYLAMNYDANNYLIAVSNQLGEKLKYIYSPATGSDRKFIGIDYPDGSNYRYAFSPADGNKISSYRDQRGNSTQIKYVDGKVSEVINALGNSTKINYAVFSTEITDALGRKNLYEFNLANLLIYSTNVKGYKEFYQYDSNYNLTSTTPVLPEEDTYFYRWTYNYDQNNNLTRETNPLGDSSTYEYAGNDLVKATDAKGAVISNTYSADGKRSLLSSTDQNGAITNYQYDPYGRVIALTDSKKQVSKYSYTINGDIQKISTPKNETSIFSYDFVGRKISDKSPLGKLSKYVYDIMSRIISVIDPSGLSINYVYDAGGNKIKEILPSGTERNFNYDKLGRLVRVTDEIGASINYSYDAVGNRIMIVDAKGKTTSFSYDELNQIISKTDPAGNTVNLTYDRSGNITTAKNENGVSSNNNYDKLDRVTNSTNSEGSTGVSYDKNGNLLNLSASKNSENANLSYDSKGSLINLASSVAGNSNYNFDTVDNLTQSQTDTNKINYNYDSNGQLTKVNNTLNSTGAVIGSLQILRDSDGKVTKLTKQNGDVTTYAYDNSARITGLQTKTPSGYTSTTYQYTYDSASNIISEAGYHDEVKNYSYNQRNELLSDNDSTYSYDLMGNRTTKVSGGITTSYSYDEAGDGNRLLNISSSDGKRTSYEYDKAGNVIKETKNGQITTYSYDADNNFTKAAMPDGTQVEYGYDKLLAHRIWRKQTSPDGTSAIIKFVYDGDKLISETDGSGKVLISYTWDENENLASFSYTNPSGKIDNYSYLKNAKGDIVGLSDAAGNDIIRYEYDSWGKVQRSYITMPFFDGTSLSPDINSRLYGGYWYDRTLNLYFMKTRMYNPEIGRFLSKDQGSAGITALDLNPYLYCNNNPISRIDPSGKSWFSAIAGFVVGAAAAIVALVVEATIGIAIAVAAAVGALVGAAVGTYQYYRQNKGKTNWKGYTKAAVTGASQGAVGGALGGAIIGGISAAVHAAITYTAGLGGYGAITTAGEVGGGGYTASKIIQSNVPQKAYDVMNKVLQNNGKLAGYSSKIYKNVTSPKLPANASYFEHDVNPLIKGVNRGMERLVFGNDGSVNFTPDHFDTWIKLK